MTDIHPTKMTESERAHWLADKVPAINDYTGEALDMLRRLADRPDLTAIVRSSIVAYNEALAGNPYHPGYTEHERIAWEAGHSAGGWGGKC
mgnify:CR=1 FL=1